MKTKYSSYLSRNAVYSISHDKVRLFGYGLDGKRKFEKAVCYSLEEGCHIVLKRLVSLFTITATPLIIAKKVQKAFFVEK